MRLSFVQVIIIFLVIYFLFGGNLKFLQKRVLGFFRYISVEIQKFFNSK